MLNIEFTKSSPNKAGKYLATVNFEDFVLVDVLGEGDDTWFMSVFSDINLRDCWWSVEPIKLSSGGED
jgi:hypothetical protein